MLGRKPITVGQMDWRARARVYARRLIPRASSPCTAKRTPRYHALIDRCKSRTGYPVIVNTSFNVRREPIVCSPEDAFRCFMGTEIEMLAVGNCLLRKERQVSSLRQDYRERFELD